MSGLIALPLSSQRRGPRAGLLFGAAWLAALVGCGGSQSQSVAQEASNLKSLTLLYGRFLSAHRGAVPASETEFEQFIQSLPPDQLAALKATNARALFTSERDHEPYVILYGTLAGPPGPAGQPVFAYERTGVGGKRFVGSSLDAVEEVDEARFKQIVPQAK